MPNTPPPLSHHGASEWYLAQIVEEAGADDEKLLRLLAQAMEETEEHAERIRNIRDDAARRLREKGLPMQRIAKLAGVTDSALARRILNAGATRRVDRRRRR